VTGVKTSSIEINNLDIIHYEELMWDTHSNGRVQSQITEEILGKKILNECRSVNWSGSWNKPRHFTFPTPEQKNMPCYSLDKILL
jgi:hypothetical protein